MAVTASPSVAVTSDPAGNWEAASGMTGSGKLCFIGRARPQAETLRVQCTKANAAGLNTQAGMPGRGHFAASLRAAMTPFYSSFLPNINQFTVCWRRLLRARSMVRPDFLPMFIAHIFAKLSVRARIVVLGVIPVVGFLANGIAFLSGDAAVESAFDTVHRNPEGADASRDLKAGLLVMRAATTDFVAHPSDAEVKNFDDGQAMAMACLDRIQASLAAADQDSVMPLRITVRDLKASFDSLVNEQKSLGYDEAEGVTADLIAASNAVENVIHNDLSWIGDVDRANLTTSLLTLRRYENEYRLTRNEAAERHYLDEAKHFNELFESVDGAPAMKEKLNKQIQTYSSTFAQWVASTEDITPLVSLINHDTESVLPEADKIIAAARDNARSAAAELAAPRTR